CQHGYGTPKSF
nr:immunoglobulin light chain junction region [Macaca mulatta]